MQLTMEPLDEMLASARAMDDAGMDTIWLAEASISSSGSIVSCMTPIRNGTVMRVPRRRARALEGE